MTTSTGIPPKPRGVVFPFVRVYKPDSASYAQFAETIDAFAVKEGRQADTKAARTLVELREYLGGTSKVLTDVWGGTHTLDTQGLEAFGSDALFVVGWRSYLPAEMPTRFVGDGNTVLEEG